MTERIGERVLKEANYIAQRKATVRQTAARFGVSKSTVHKDIVQRLKKEDAALYERVRQVLEINKAERHLRGGEATFRKFRAAAKVSTK